MDLGQHWLLRVFAQVGMIEACALIVLLFLSAFFSSSETVLFSLTLAQRKRIGMDNLAAECHIARCLQDKAILLSTLLVGNTFVNFVIAALGYRLFCIYLPGFEWLAIPVMTILLLAFGEITPKRLALRYTEAWAPYVAYFLRFWLIVLSPLNVLLRFSSRAFAPMLEYERRALSDDELISVLDSAAEHGDLAGSDAAMIEGVLRLSELSANDEMTPRVDIEGYDVELGDVRRQSVCQHAGHHFLPVFRRTLDNIVGILDTRKNVVSDALFVPETMTLDDLLVTFVKCGNTLAIVLDEYGGTAGLISQNDVLELIFGPSVFGNASQEPALVRKAEHVWEIDARVNLDEINRALDLKLEAGDADRLSGWVAFHASSLPHVGQEIVADCCRATVLRRRGHRVTLVRLEVLHQPDVVADDVLIGLTDEAVRKTEEDDA